MVGSKFRVPPHEAYSLISALRGFQLSLFQSFSFSHWWALSDSNRRPKDYESSALTAELRARK